jgi:hypothetical protein
MCNLKKLEDSFEQIEVADIAPVLTAQKERERERLKGRSTKKKPQLIKLAQVFVRPEVFSIYVHDTTENSGSGPVLLPYLCTYMYTALYKWLLWIYAN